MESNHAELMRACGLSLALCSTVSPKEVQVESNHSELMRACGLIHTLVVFCCTSRFGMIEPHRTHASLWSVTSSL